MESLPIWLLGSSRTLNYLRIEDCANLTSLPKWLTRIESLQEITIQKCKNLSDIPIEVLKYLPKDYKDKYSERQHQIHRSSSQEKGARW